MTNGVINLLKPPGMTSHDAVSFVRRTFQQKKVGHSGTLDSAAAGVLPIYLGYATRLVEYGEDFDKEYRAEILFGIATSTGDDTGALLRQVPVGPTALDFLEPVLATFCGTYEQVPPMYSALKVAGRKLYELAREGKEVVRLPRPVKIREIRLLYRQVERAGILVACSKGTYIRTLCEDIGARLGIPATMAFLLRTRVGPFGIAQTSTLEEVAAQPADVVLPPDAAVAHCPVVRLDAAGTRLLQQGQAVQALPEYGLRQDAASVRLYSATDSFFGMGQFEAETGLICPKKIFGDGNDRDVADKEPV
jgi:tRNA pseudouridine55 synthase